MGYTLRQFHVTYSINTLKITLKSDYKGCSWKKNGNINLNYEIKSKEMRILYRGYAKFLGEFQERVGCTKTGKKFVSTHVPTTVLEEPSKGCDSP